jgi:hypothetical protein
MGHYGPKLEAERDETLGQNLRERGQKTSIFHFRLEVSASYTIASHYNLVCKISLQAANVIILK